MTFFKVLLLTDFRSTTPDTLISLGDPDIRIGIISVCYKGDSLQQQHLGYGGKRESLSCIPTA